MARLINLIKEKKSGQGMEAVHPAKKGLEVESAGYYQELLKQNPLNQDANNRLMIVYRKLKKYKKELQVISNAIKAFESFYKSHQKKTGKTIQTISNKLNRSLGLTDTRGKAVDDAQPIAAWKKRKEAVLKKIKRK